SAMGCTVAVFSSASRRRHAHVATSSAALRASAGLPLVIAWTEEVGLARFPGECALDEVHPRRGASPLQDRRGQDRNLHGGTDRWVVAADGADQHAGRALALQAAVVVREVFRAEREVGLTQELGVLVAVRIEGGGDEG